METSTLLLSLLIILAATTFCVLMSSRIGLGSVVGFIAAGLLIGPNTPGPVAADQVTLLQNISELGVVLFLFLLGLEMQPRRIWNMRRELIGLGGSQVLVCALVAGLFIYFWSGIHWQSAVIIGLGVAMSSTAVVMTTLEQRGELHSTYGSKSFSVLMAQDLAIVPVMALIPILGSGTGADIESNSIWQRGGLALAVLLAILMTGRYLLPAALSWTARHRNNQAFGILLFLAVAAAAWAVDLAGISMTLGAFLLGILLSDSDYRFQIEGIILPFKATLMGLFFIAVGMAIDVNLLLEDLAEVLILVVAIILIKVVVITLLCHLFKIDWANSIRCGFTLCQVGEFAFVLFGAATVGGLLNERGVALGFLVVSFSMILAPLLIQAGNALASKINVKVPADMVNPVEPGLSNHLVVVGLDEVGLLVAALAQSAELPYIGVDRNYDAVRRARTLGLNAVFGDVTFDSVRMAVSMGSAKALFVSSEDIERLKSITFFLSKSYPTLNIHLRTHTIAQQEMFRARGIKHAGTAFVESTLFRGSSILKDMGVPSEQAKRLVDNLRKDDYSEIKRLLVN